MLCIWCGLVPAAWAFGWSLFLTVELNNDEIHPDDYASAKLWRDFWSPVFAIFPPLMGAAYTFTFFAFLGIMSLKVKPTLTAVTTVQAVYVCIATACFFGGFPWFYWRRRTLKQQLHDEREEATARLSADKALAAAADAEASGRAEVAGYGDDAAMLARMPLGATPL